VMTWTKADAQTREFDSPDIIFKREGGMIVEAIVTTISGIKVAGIGDWIVRNQAGQFNVIPKRSRVRAS